MVSRQVPLWVLSLVFIVQCEGATDIGDYIVDCAACNSVPVEGVSSYSCKVRCGVQGLYIFLLYGR